MAQNMTIDQAKEEAKKQAEKAARWALLQIPAGKKLELTKEQLLTMIAGAAEDAAFRAIEATGATKQERDRESAVNDRKAAAAERREESYRSAYGNGGGK